MGTARDRQATFSSLQCRRRNLLFILIVISQAVRHGFCAASTYSSSKTSEQVPTERESHSAVDVRPLNMDSVPLNQDNGLLNEEDITSSNQDNAPGRPKQEETAFDWLGGKNPEELSSTAENEDRHGNVEEQTNSKCCYRQRKFSTIGFDTAARRPIRKDVGRCRRTYLTEPSAKNPTSSVRDEFKRTRRQEPLTQCDQPCNDGNSCLPTRILLEQSLYANTWTSTDYEVVEDCQCVPRVHPCDRMPLFKVFHHNTPYETTIDVGECRGRCFAGSDSDLECRAIQNKTETVLGPNGHECVEVVTSCACAESCYRASHVVSFYIIKHNETTGEPYETVQEMDVGKCVGGCVDRKGVCIRNTNCAAILLPNTHCSPKEYVPHTFLTRDRENLTVHVVNECRCF
ncbi:uncharacterized protein LOC117304060 [Asterias rubens]|uniref:uncharacterized protein LOC117304060 n=1 Tax=Asterias rubens TaxID=7604 RepID=UPI00145585C6|nr:uncharacterized protein LOC117304060 [Asterias rubens]